MDGWILWIDWLPFMVIGIINWRRRQVAKSRSCQTVWPRARVRLYPRAATANHRERLSRTGGSASHSSNTSHASDTSRDSSTGASGAVQARSVDGVPRQCPANNRDARGTSTTSPHAQVSGQKTQGRVQSCRAHVRSVTLVTVQLQTHMFHRLLPALHACLSAIGFLFFCGGGFCVF